MNNSLNPLVCLEISSNRIKMLIGYEENGVPVALYTKEKAIPGLMKNGTISDEGALISALQPFHQICDESVKLRVSISDVCLVLPPIGFSVFEAMEMTSTVNQDNTIQELDITNAIGLVSKKKTPAGLETVDIIPDSFALDNNKVCREPPLGEKSRAVTVHALVHALPSQIKSQFLTVIARAGFRVKKSCVSSYCNALLNRVTEGMPESYILIDVGSQITSASPISQGNPYYGSSCFFYGGDKLTQAMVEAFGIPYEIAETLKKEYGHDSRQRGFNRPLFTNPNSNGSKIFQNDLNRVIENEFVAFSTLLRKSIDEMDKNCGSSGLPLVFTGGASQLYGLSYLLHSVFPNRAISFLKPHVVGARDPGYSALLGLLLAASSYTGSLEDNFLNVSGVSRSQESSKLEKRKKKFRNDSSKDEDVL